MLMRTSSGQSSGEASSRWAAWGREEPAGSSTRCSPTGEDGVDRRVVDADTESPLNCDTNRKSCGGWSISSEPVPYPATYEHRDRAALCLPPPRAGRARLDPL